ncbi:MAG TPA: sulfite exporter TauE/SafE family protein [Dehalococcoidia bacterium]|nr:sulfite exporter TauE/SafE family protein [Dehalococcoidia bacterium]
MELIHVLILLGTGVFAGFASGLLGVGGGFIMAPVQYFVFLHMGLTADSAIKLAFGTNLLVILLNSLSGTWRHHKLGAVNWRAAVVMGISGMAFAYAGATLAAHLPGEVLRIAFGVVVLLVAVRMFTSKAVQAEREPVTNPWVWFAWAIPLGLLGGIMGLGGGVVAVPIMVLALRFKIHNAVATSLAMIIFNSVGGMVGYIVNGQGIPGLPPYSIGYVNLLSAFILAVSSFFMVQVGAIVAHKLPGRRLRLIFILLMFYIGLRMIGVFEWLDWPL